MPDPFGLATVGLGLVAGGAIAGAVAGAVGATLTAAVWSGAELVLSRRIVEIWGMTALLGAPVGAVLLPLVGFSVLRRVTLGRLLGATIAGTALGGAVAAVVRGGSAPLLGAVAGFTSAVGWL